MERIPMTRAGYEKLKAELARLEQEEMPELERRVAQARAEGDLSENAEYHGARESLALLHARASALRDKLARAVIVKPEQADKNCVAMGATIVVKDLDSDEQEQYTLVGAGEEDYAAGKILVTSPLAQGFVGKRVGETVEIKVPMGLVRYQILEIRYPE